VPVVRGRWAGRTVEPMTTPSIETPEAQKARGAFYTPASITTFLAAWAVRSRDDRVIEPSCGDGSFIVSLAERYTSLGRTNLADVLFGVELEEGEAAKAQALAPTATIRQGSFFALEPEGIPTATAIIGNPPFIRYHGWTGEARAESLRRASQLGVELTGLASSWASFVVWATAFLPPDDGRLALVLPAELLSTEYAEPVRRFLLRRFSSVVVVAFDRLAFDAQVDAVLLLASNDDERGLRVLHLHDDRALETLTVPPSGTPLGPRTAETIAEYQTVGRRWTSEVHGEAGSIYDDLRRSGQVVTLGDIAEVDIGLVSGATSYFVLTDSAAREHHLPARVLRRVVQRPSDLRGIRTEPKELRWLFYPPEHVPSSDRHVRAYLRLGEAQKVPERYKPSTRRFWYRVPLPRIRPSAFLPYMTHHAPRLITNPDDALNTNLVHGVAFRPGAPDPRITAAAMLSAATWLSAEIEGRAYGGGVLKLETKEAERLAVPVVTEEVASSLLADFDALDALIREGRTSEASAIVDAHLGLDHDSLVLAADTYRRRRTGRKSSRRGVGVMIERARDGEG
jgi:adenine-specific DNA-methyltransferase